MNNYEEIVGIKTRFENSTEAELNHTFIHLTLNGFYQVIQM